MRRARMSFLFTMGLLVVGFIVIGAAFVYRSGQTPPATPPATGGSDYAIASVKLPFKTFDGNGRAELEALPKDTALAFLCRSGGRSQQAAEEFRALGFTNVHNVTGGINAWADDVDGTISKY